MPTNISLLQQLHDDSGCYSQGVRRAKTTANPIGLVLDHRNLVDLVTTALGTDLPTDVKADLERLRVTLTKSFPPPWRPADNADDPPDAEHIWAAMDDLADCVQAVAWVVNEALITAGATQRDSRCLSFYELREARAVDLRGGVLRCFRCGEQTTITEETTEGRSWRRLVCESCGCSGGWPLAASSESWWVRPVVAGRPEAAPQEPTFRRTGEYWMVTLGDGEVAHIEDGLGAQYVHLLLQNPRRALHCLELQSLAQPRRGREVYEPAPIERELSEDARPLSALSRGPARDAADTIQAYGRTVADLNSGVEEAERNNDLARAEELRAQRERVAREILELTGLGGRPREHSEAEDARKAVGAAIRRFLKKVEDHAPAAGRHLRKALRLGKTVAYDPETRLEWRT